MTLFNTEQTSFQMKNRRIFFKTSFAAIALFAIIRFGNQVKATQTTKVMPKSFVHQVYFWLKDPKNVEVRKKFEKGLAMMDTIPQIRESHIGIPPKSEREVVDGSFTYSYLVIFDNKEDHDIYQKHEIHLKFIEENSELWERVQVYDAQDS